ncbi:hypothetical protein AC630_40660, partial [Bradyrhizobium sp. AS23.2]
MRRASQRQQPEMNMLRFTKGTAAAPLLPPVARQIGRASDGGSEGTALADPKARVWLSRRGLRVGMRRWRKGLASAFVIRWPFWPSGP